MRLLLLYHGLLTCCGVKKSRDGLDLAEFYVLRPANLPTFSLARPLQTRLVEELTSPVFLLDSPTTASVADYFQRITASSVRRLNEYGYRQGVLKWYEAWLESSDHSEG